MIMRDALARELLAKIMKWEPSDLADETADLQAMTFRYDEYQQFTPGMRFFESLALWLAQFKTLGEKQIAYQFVRKKMLFISPREMFHLVSLTYPDIIQPILITIHPQSTGSTRT